MKPFLFIVVILISTAVLAQAPQFAVVKPDGTTHICPTFDSAYNIAQNDDHIYLPPGVFTLSQPIAKQLNIVGSGIDPDSSYLGITVISGNISFTKGSSNSFIEGIKFSNNITFGIDGNDTSHISGITFQRAEIGAISMAYYTIIATNILFNECIIYTATGGWYYNATGWSGSSQNWAFTKCLIRTIYLLNNCQFINNNFVLQGGASQSSINSSNFSNNIFAYASGSLNTTNCNFYNNINSAENIGSSNNIVNDYTVTNTDSIFIYYSRTGPYATKWSLKTGNPGIMGGTDGTDVGIYGTAQPTALGWIPSNPHIYFKLIAPQTNPDGTLPVQIKVRTGN